MVEPVLHFPLQRKADTRYTITDLNLEASILKPQEKNRKSLRPELAEDLLLREET